MGVVFCDQVVAVACHHSIIIAHPWAKGKGKINIFVRFFSRGPVMHYMMAGMKPQYNIPKLRNAMVASGLTKQQIARQSGLSAVTVSYTLSAAKTPKTSTMRRIAAVLDMALADVVIPEPEGA